MVNWKERIRRLLGLPPKEEQHWEEEHWKDSSVTPEEPKSSSSGTSLAEPLPIEHERNCPQCGDVVPAEARFCAHCGPNMLKAPRFPSKTSLPPRSTQTVYPPPAIPSPSPFPVFLTQEEECLQIIEQAAQDEVTVLNLSDRRLTKLPREIGQLTHLTTLILNNNRLTTLPKEIGHLQHLKELSIRRNGTLLEVPSELWSIKSLEKLGLGGNEISTISEEIENLTNLTELSLWGNSFTSIPLEVFTLKNIRLLNLSHLQLEVLPKEVGNLTNLEVLSAADNNLRQLPKEIKNLTKLKELWLYNNHLPIPPEILSRRDEPATILDYYFREQKTPLNEAKLVLVGEGGVGKTSLVRRLIEGEFDEHEAITEGININQWAVGVGDGQIRLNVWDFGGQEIMHATHQFFLTQRTLYLVVLEARREEVGSRLEYWLKMVQSFGADSPIVVVTNKIDQHRLVLNQRDLQQRYPSIKAFISTSCKTGEGIAELTKEITRIIDDLPHVRDLIPAPWLAIKRELEVMERDYLTYQAFVRLCEANGIGEEKEQRVLIRLLHDLGVVLNFADDPKLKETGVLNPEWVTGGVYQIINADVLKRSHGILEIRQLDEILQMPAYPREKHWFIIDMMRKFELCFDLEGLTDQKFLIPDLLPKAEPTFEWHDAENPENPENRFSLRFEYHYDFLPRSIISRFIVRMHRFIFQQTPWRDGVVLVNNAERAIVRASPHENKITIAVGGDSRDSRRFLQRIREQLENIHKSFANLKVRAKVPIPYHNCVIAYKRLSRLHHRGITYYEIEVDDEWIEVNVRALFASYEAEAKSDEQQQAAQNLDQYLGYLKRQMHPQKYHLEVLALGKRHYEWGEYTLARQALLAVHEAMQNLRGMVEADRAQLELSEKSIGLYEMLTHCYLAEGQQSKAFEYAAIGKGRAFVKKLAEAKLDFSAVGESQLFAQKLDRCRQLRHELSALEGQVGDGESDRRGQQHLLLRREIDLWREMANEHPILTATLTVPTLSAEQAKALAKELDATLVEYYRHDGGWCAFIVTSHQIRYVPLPNVDGKFLESLADWRNNVHLRAGRSRRRLKRLAKLYEAAVAPLGLVSGRVVMAPFRELHLLPLSASYDAELGRYLAEDYTLSYVPSLTALYVVYQEQKRRPSSQGFERLLSVAYPGTPPLPNVLAEAEAIAESLAGVAAVERLHEEEATADKVLKRLSEAPNCDVIHFGCHGSFDSRQPKASGLMLAEKPLTIEEIITKLNLKQTRLATLAACLTGEVALRDGEEHIGLLQAMMTAGVETVVASLWAVDDAATRALFEAFYRREALINAPAQAMREASKLLRETKAWKHPFYWAAFAVNGLAPPALASDEESPEWLPADLVAKMEAYTQESTRQRSDMMTDQKVIENADLLLKDLLQDCGNVLHALEPPYHLSQEIAQKQVVAGELGLAQALHWIVQDNPALHEFMGNASRVAALSIEPSQHLDAQKAPPCSEKNGQAWNEVSNIYQDFVTALQQQYESPANNHQKEGLLKKIFGRFL